MREYHDITVTGSQVISWQELSLQRTMTTDTQDSEHVLSEGVIAVTPTFNGPIILFYISIIGSRDQFERFVTFW